MHLLSHLMSTFSPPPPPPPTIISWWRIFLSHLRPKTYVMCILSLLQDGVWGGGGGGGGGWNVYKHWLLIASAPHASWVPLWVGCGCTGHCRRHFSHGDSVSSCQRWKYRFSHACIILYGVVVVALLLPTVLLILLFILILLLILLFILLVFLFLLLFLLFVLFLLYILLILPSSSFSSSVSSSVSSISSFPPLPLFLTLLLLLLFLILPLLTLLLLLLSLPGGTDQ